MYVWNLNFGLQLHPSTTSHLIVCLDAYWGIPLLTSEYVFYISHKSLTFLVINISTLIFHDLESKPNIRSLLMLLLKLVSYGTLFTSNIILLENPPSFIVIM